MSESESVIDRFRSSFLRRSILSSGPDATVVDRPGVCGTLGSASVPGRLLVTDDRAVPFLEQLSDTAHLRMISVFDSAPRAVEVVAGLPGFTRERATAMMRPNLDDLPEPSLPDSLTLRPIRRADHDPDDGVGLESAAASCLQSDPGLSDLTLDGFVDYLRSLPFQCRLLAAVDSDGTVRATSGGAVIGPFSMIFFVSTDTGWRGRGIGTAMTAAALEWARGAGGDEAALEATPAGLPIYERLGFDRVSDTTLFADF